MENEYKISTLISFETEGFDDANANLQDAVKSVNNLKTKLSELAEIQKKNAKTIEEYTAQWRNAENQIDNNAEGLEALRSELEKARRTILELNVENARLSAQEQQVAKDLLAAQRAAEAAQKATENYNKVLTELEKGIDEATVTMEEMTEAKKALSKELAKVDINSDAYKTLSEQMNKVNAAMKEVAARSKSTKKDIDENANTVAAMRLRVSELTKEWKELDRASPEYKQKTKELAELVEETKRAEEEVGNYTRSVGNYEKAGLSLLSGGNPLASSMMQTAAAAPSAKEAVKGMIGGIKSVNVAMKSMVSNPIVMIIAAVVAVIMALKKGIESNEESLQKFHKILEPVKTLLELILIPLQLQAELALIVMEKVTDLALAFSRLLEILPFVGEYLKEFNDEMEKSIELSEAEITLEKQKRANLVENAKNEKEIAEYRAKIAQKDKYTAEERRSMLEDVIALEKKNATEKLKIVEEELRIAQQRNSINANDAEANQELAEKQAAAYTAQKEHAQKMIELNGQMSELNRSLKAEEQARIQKSIEIQKKYIEQTKKNTSEYINSIKARQAIEAEISAKQNDPKVDEKEIALLQRKLNTAISIETAASKKRIKLTKEELDTIELEKYLHEQRLIKNQDEGDKAKAAIYISANDAVITAQQNLLAAKIKGNETEINLLTEILEFKKATLNKAFEYQMYLTDEELTQLELKKNSSNVRFLDGFKETQDKILALQLEYQEVTTIADQERIKSEIATYQEKLKLYTDAAAAAGVSLDTISDRISKNFAKNGAALNEALQSGFDQMNENVETQENFISKTYKKVAAAFSKAFDFAKATKGMDKNTKAFKKMKKDVIASIAEIGAAQLHNINETVMSSIIEKTEMQKKAIDDVANYELARAQNVKNSKHALLELELSEGKITEAKYKLEKMKADDEQQKKEYEISKKRADQEYNINLKTFKVNQANSAISTAISTAAAIMQGYAQTGPIMGNVFAAILGTLGATQVGLIYSKKPPQKPKFERGGMVQFANIEGKSHANGGEPVFIGNKQIAEVEGDEGALIISKKAMRNKYMKNLIAKISQANREISGGSEKTDFFANGGELKFRDYNADFFQPVKNSLVISDVKKKSLKINGQKLSTKKYGYDADAAIDGFVEELIKPAWNAYVTKMKNTLEKREQDITEGFSSGIKKNETLKSYGITDAASYNAKIENTSQNISDVNKTIKTYQDAADARIASLKLELDFENKIADFDKRKEAANKKKIEDEKSLNLEVLKSLRNAGELSVTEYEKYCDQIMRGYGATTDDIQNLLSKSLEKVKKEINAARDFELKAADKANDYRMQAVEQWQNEWSEKYNDVTESIASDVLNAGDLVNQLSGKDLEVYNEILQIETEIYKISEKYSANESKLTDGIIESRSEREALLKEQKEISLELEKQNELKEIATEKFKEQRENAAAASMKRYEAANLESILPEIDEMTKGIAEQGELWDLTAQVAADYESQVLKINESFDLQIEAQDKILENLKLQHSQIEKNNEITLAGIDDEKMALEENYNQRVDEINSWLQSSTSEMKNKVTDLTAQLNEISVAGVSAGLSKYEAAMRDLSKQVDTFSSVGSEYKYADGGELDFSGVATLSGASHANGGIPIFAGNKQIAEVEGGESMFVVKKNVAALPETQAALQRISDLNISGGGKPLGGEIKANPFALDYGKLAAMIGEQINNRPQKSYITTSEIDEAVRLENTMFRARGMR